MRWLPGIAILSCAACEGGRGGLLLEKVATLPRLGDNIVGFDADGTPIVGFEAPPSPLLRLDGTRWSPHAAQMPFSTLGIGVDGDGAPLVLHAAGGTSPMSEVWRVELDGTARRIGGPLFSGVLEVMQDASGTHYLFSTMSMWFLPPGASIWEQGSLALRDPVRGADGRIYAQTFSRPEVVRVEANGSFTPTLCSGIASGVDPSGRLYFSRFSNLEICDQATGEVDKIAAPGGMTIHSLRVTDRRVVAAAGEVGRQGDRAMLSMPLGGTTLTPVIFGSGVPDPPSTFSLLVAPTGTVFAVHGDWLGHVVEDR